MDGFLQHTAESIVSHFGWDNLKNLTLVFPTHRAGLVLKNELKTIQRTRTLSPVLLPQITTLTELFDSFSPLYKEEELLVIFRLYRIYQEVTGETVSADLFYGWGRQLLADFNNIDKSIMSDDEVRRFFKNSVEAKQLEELQIDDEVRSRLNDLLCYRVGKHTGHSEDGVRQKYIKLWQNLYPIYQRLNEELQAEQKGYEGARMRKVITDWQTLLPCYEGRHYVFIGFNYLMPVEKQLMRLLYDQSQANFYWDYIADFQTNEKAYSFIRQHISDFSEATLSLPEEWSNTQPIKVISASSANAQAQYAGQWLRENYTRKGQSTAIVICDEQMLEPVIYALPPITLPGIDKPELVNITKGFPLSSTQIYSDVMAYLSDRHHDIALAENYTSLLDRLLRDVLAPAEEKAKRTLTDDAEKENSWQWLLIQESLYQTRLVINQFRRVLLSNVIPQATLKLSLVCTLLGRCLSSVSLPFHGEPITDIQVMGVLETRLLDFDNLLLLNVEEGVVPQKQADFSFIPYYLRKAYSMQTREESASVYAYNFFRLLSRAGNTTLIFSDAAMELEHKTMSRFVMQMMVSTAPKFQMEKYTLSENNQLNLETPVDLENNTTNLLSLLEKNADGILCYKSGKILTLSPSAINTYIDCPRRFYFQYIWGIREDDQESLIFAPNTLGSFVHSAMEHIYKDKCGCVNGKNTRISPQMLNKILDSKIDMEQVLEAAYQAQNKEYARRHANTQPPYYIKDEHPMENEVIRGYIRHILERDIDDAKGDLQIRLLEEDRTFSVDMGANIGVVQVGGIIDRLDILNGVMRVVDYKSGSYKKDKVSAKWEALLSDKKGKYVLQTFIYCEAVEQNDHKGDTSPLQPTLYFPQRKLVTTTSKTVSANNVVETTKTPTIGTIETTKTPITVSIIGEDKTANNDAVEVTDYNIYREQFMPVLTDKLREILTTTDFPQTNSDNDCSPFCPFLQLCNRHPQSFQ